MDACGNGTLVWLRTGTADVMAARHLHGGSWTSPSRLGTTRNSSYHQAVGLVANANGETIASLSPGRPRAFGERVEVGERCSVDCRRAPSFRGAAAPAKFPARVVSALGEDIAPTFHEMVLSTARASDPAWSLQAESDALRAAVDALDRFHVGRFPAVSHRGAEVSETVARADGGAPDGSSAFNR
jgi:hypothetical protein